MSDAGRLSREAEFHDRWAAEIDPASALVDESFTAITALENAHVARTFGDVRGLRILDYGCGAAEAGVYFAKQGATGRSIDDVANICGAGQFEQLE